MSTTYYITDTNSTFETGQDWCKELGSSAGSAGLSCSVAGQSVEYNYACSIANVPNLSEWDTGAPSVVVDVTSAGDVDLTVIVCRYNLSGVRKESTASYNIHTISSETQYTFNFISKDWAAGNATDRLVIEFEFSNSGKSTQNVTLGNTSATYITMPWDEEIIITDAGVGEGDGEALAASQGTQIAGIAEGDGEGLDAEALALGGIAEGDGEALDAINETQYAGIAEGSGEALGAINEIQYAGLAEADGEALDATQELQINLVAEGSGEALSAINEVQFAGMAEGSGEALDASWGITAGYAESSGEALGAINEVQYAGIAQGSGEALDAQVLAIGGIAEGDGEALGASQETQIAGIAEGGGEALDAVADIAGGVSYRRYITPCFRQKPINPVLNASHPLAQGLLVAYIFNQENVSIIPDLSGNGIHLTVNYTYGEWTTGGIHSPGIENYGTAGMGNFVASNADANIFERCAITNELTIEAIFKKATNASWDCLCHIKAGTVQNLYHLGGLFTNIQQLAFMHGRELDTFYAYENLTSSILTTDTMYHVVCTSKLGAAVSTMRGYINGIEGDYSPAYPDLGIGSSVGNLPQRISVGGSWNWDEPFDGEIYLLRVWDRALSHEEAIALYESPYAMFHDLAARRVSIGAAGGYTVTDAGVAEGSGEALDANTTNIGFIAEADGEALDAVTSEITFVAEGDGEALNAANIVQYPGIAEGDGQGIDAEVPAVGFIAEGDGQGLDAEVPAVAFIAEGDGEALDAIQEIQIAGIAEGVGEALGASTEPPGVQFASAEGDGEALDAEVPAVNFIAEGDGEALDGEVPAAGFVAEGDGEALDGEVPAIGGLAEGDGEALNAEVPATPISAEGSGEALWAINEVQFAGIAEGDGEGLGAIVDAIGGVAEGSGEALDANTITIAFIAEGDGEALEPTTIEIAGLAEGYGEALDAIVYQPGVAFVATAIGEALDATWPGEFGGGLGGITIGISIGVTQDD